MTNTEMPIRGARAIALVACLTFAWQGHAQALAIFTYTGSEYTAYTTDYAGGSITGSFQLADPSDPTSLTGAWSFSDGWRSIGSDDANATLTIDQGAWSYSAADNLLSGWLVEIESVVSGDPAYIRTTSTSRSCGGSQVLDCAIAGADYGAVAPPFGALGGWEISIQSASAVPAPSALALFILGLAALAVAGRCRAPARA